MKRVIDGRKKKNGQNFVSAAGKRAFNFSVNWLRKRCKGCIIIAVTDLMHAGRSQGDLTDRGGICEGEMIEIFC